MSSSKYGRCLKYFSAVGGNKNSDVNPDVNINNNVTKDHKYKDDLSEDLNRLGGDWKSDPVQQEEAKIWKEKYEQSKEGGRVSRSHGKTEKKEDKEDKVDPQAEGDEHPGWNS